MEDQKNTLTYKDKMGKRDAYRLFISAGIPLFIFGAALVVIGNFADFGTKMICPMTGVMWGFGVVVAAFMPSMRKEILRQTHIALISYLAILIFFKFMIAIASGVSTDMIAASYNQSIPIASGNAFSGYLPTMMWATALLFPIGFMGLEGRRLLQFKKNNSLQKTFGQTRSIRDAGKDKFEQH